MVVKHKDRLVKSTRRSHQVVGWNHKQGGGGKTSPTRTRGGPRICTDHPTRAPRPVWAGAPITVQSNPSNDTIPWYHTINHKPHVPPALEARYPFPIPPAHRAEHMASQTSSPKPEPPAGNSSVTRTQLRMRHSQFRGVVRFPGHFSPRTHRKLTGSPLSFPTYLSTSWRKATPIFIALFFITFPLN